MSTIFNILKHLIIRLYSLNWLWLNMIYVNYPIHALHELVHQNIYLPRLLFLSLFFKGLHVSECVCVFPGRCLNIWVFVSITNSINIHDWFNYHQYIQNIALLECHSNIYHFAVWSIGWLLIYTYAVFTRLELLICVSLEPLVEHGMK